MCGCEAHMGAPPEPHQLTSITSPPFLCLQVHDVQGVMQVLYTGRCNTNAV